MKPYYETGLGRLWHGDCLEGLGNIKKIYNLVLTDPPYGIKIGGAKGVVGGAKGVVGGGKIVKPIEYGFCQWDLERPTKETFEELFRVSENQIIFGGNYFIDYLYPTSCLIVWDKDNTGNFADCEVAWTSFKTAVRKIKYRWNGYMKEAPEERFHPTQKPVGLFIRILDKYSKQGDFILDPFSGSGTTALACERTNRRWLCIEKEEKYCEISAKRIEQETKQYKLFANG